MSFIKSTLQALKKAYCFKNEAENDKNVTQIRRVYIYSPIQFVIITIHVLLVFI